MAAISDSPYASLFQNVQQSQSMFGPQQNGVKGMSQVDVDHQQKLVQLQQQARANMHMHQTGGSAIHVSQSMNGTSDTIPSQMVQLGSYSALTDNAVDNMEGGAISTASHINFNGTPSLSASLTSSEVSSLSSQEADQRASLSVPNTMPKPKSPTTTESSAISPVPVVNLGVTVTAPSSVDSRGDGNICGASTSENNLNITLGNTNGVATFSQLQQLAATSVGDLSVTTSAGFGLGEIAENPSSSSSTGLANISSIWSNPVGMMPSDGQALLSDHALYQAFQAQQQQQQMSAAWANQQNAAALSGIGNPAFSNPLSSPNMFINGNGLSNAPNTQQQAQLQALQQQLALRRSQTIQAMHAGLHRSSSFQPTSLGIPKGPGYSSWSSGQAAHSNNAYNNPPMRSNSTLFNSLSHSNSPSGRVTTYNGVPPGRKPSMGSHVISPPKFNRSFSTPAKYNGFGGLQMSPLSSLEDNPFLKMSVDAQSRNGNMLSSLHERNPVDTMQMSTIESQLFDILRSETNTGGKWDELGQDNLFEDSHLGLGSYDVIAPNLNQISPLLSEYGREKYSRKVFVGGLPPDIDEDEIQASFRHFGHLLVDWPHKAESKSYFPPKGYAFLLFQNELSVQNLINCCMKNDDKLYLCLSSPTIKEKPVQIRPWSLADSDFVLDGSQPLDPRKTIFVGGVPRPLRAVELAMIMDRLYGGVCYAGIDVDPELKYPKGAGRVAFSNQQSYIAAINARFVQLQHCDIDKRVEVKPYVLDDQLCDECQGARCGGKFAPFFCANVHCLQYYCEQCWSIIHSQPGRDFHKPLVKEGADRSPRSLSFRW